MKYAYMFLLGLALGYAVGWHARMDIVWAQGFLAGVTQADELHKVLSEAAK